MALRDGTGCCKHRHTPGNPEKRANWRGFRRNCAACCSSYVFIVSRTGKMGVLSGDALELFFFGKKDSK